MSFISKNESWELYEWWNPNASRDDALNILAPKPVGAFLVRPSSFEGCLALSYKNDQQQIIHHLIRRKNGLFSLNDEPTTYPSLEKLFETESFINKSFIKTNVRYFINGYPYWIDKRWFWGDITDIDAQKLLKDTKAPAGTYILRITQDGVAITFEAATGGFFHWYCYENYMEKSTEIPLYKVYRCRVDDKARLTVESLIGDNISLEDLFKKEAKTLVTPLLRSVDSKNPEQDKRLVLSSKLWWSCQHRKYNLVKELLSQGADPNAAMHNGYTPLLLSLYHTHKHLQIPINPDVPKLLIDVSNIQTLNSTALLRFSENGWVEYDGSRTSFISASYLACQLKLLDLFFAMARKGASITAALITAAFQKQLPLLKQIVDATPPSQILETIPRMLLAALVGVAMVPLQQRNNADDVALIRYLTEDLDADVNAVLPTPRDNRPQPDLVFSVFVEAFKTASLDIVKLLVDKGVDFQKRDIVVSEGRWNCIVDDVEEIASENESVFGPILNWLRQLKDFDAAPPPPGTMAEQFGVSHNPTEGNYGFVPKKVSLQIDSSPAQHAPGQPGNYEVIPDKNGRPTTTSSGMYGAMPPPKQTQQQNNNSDGVVFSHKESRHDLRSGVHHLSINQRAEQASPMKARSVALKQSVEKVENDDDDSDDDWTPQMARWALHPIQIPNEPPPPYRPPSANYLAAVHQKLLASMKS